MSGRGEGNEEKKKFTTLFSQNGCGRDGGEDEDEDEGQAFYVGGSEKSGQQVLGPPKKKAENTPEELFQCARESGTEQVDASQRGASSSNSVFRGTGYRLGDGVTPSEKIGGMDEKEEPAPVVLTLRTWRNGFTIDDGPLRTYDDPANRPFLEHAKDGRLPPELIQAHPGRRIDVRMDVRIEEEYKPPKRPFSGQGYTLGSPIPEVLGAGKVGEKVAAASSANDASASVDTQPATLPVDETKPTTNIQVRLGNGERLVLKLNNSHTIKDLRDFIGRMRPDLAGRSFILLTNFPSKELTNESMTLEESNLLNAVIIHRFK